MARRSGRPFLTYPDYRWYWGWHCFRCRHSYNLHLPACDVFNCACPAFLPRGDDRW